MTEQTRAKVYIGTSLVSHLVANRSRDLIVAARQQLTIDWWDKEREKYDLFISEAVLREARKGDGNEIAKRLNALAGIPLLNVTTETLRLADELIKCGALPAKAVVDAIHIAGAAARAD